MAQGVNGGLTKLLLGRSARVIVTMGMPALVYRWYFGAHGLKGFTHKLALVGIKPRRSILVGLVEGMSQRKRRVWLDHLREWHGAAPQRMDDDQMLGPSDRFLGRRDRGWHRAFVPVLLRAQQRKFHFRDEEVSNLMPGRGRTLAADQRGRGVNGPQRHAAEKAHAIRHGLPASVRSHLPTHAQDIYRSAFNHAWQTYGATNAARVEEIAHRVAWAAVKRRYRKVGGAWLSREVA